jgi:hypothetical protein
MLGADSNRNHAHKGPVYENDASLPETQAHLHDGLFADLVLFDERFDVESIQNCVAGGIASDDDPTAAADSGRWVLEIVKRTDAHNFVVLPKRWIVQRTLGWQPTLDARLRTPGSQRRRLHSPHHDPHHASTLGQAS